MLIKYFVLVLILCSSFSKMSILLNSQIYFDIYFISLIFNNPTASWIGLLLTALIELSFVIGIIFKVKFAKKVLGFVILIYGVSLFYSFFEYVLLGSMSSYLFINGSTTSIIWRLLIVFSSIYLYLKNQRNYSLK